MPRPWQIGEPVGIARIEVQGDTAWWVERTLSDAGTVVDGVFETAYATSGLLVAMGPPSERPGGRAEPDGAPRRDADGAPALRERHDGAGA